MSEVKQKKKAAGDLATLPPEMQSRKTELDKLDHRLWGLFQALHAKRCNERRELVRSRYDQGVILVCAEKHHADGIVAIGVAAGMTLAMIRECQLVARRISDDEVTMFITAANAVPGSSMGWVHLTELAAIESPEVRSEYVAKTAKGQLSVDQLRLLLDADDVKRYSMGKRPGAGRPFALPGNVGGIFDKFRRQTEQYRRFIDQAGGDALTTLVRESPGEKIGADGLAKMREGREAMASLRDDLDAKLAVFDDLLAEVAPGIEAAAHAAIVDARATPVPMPPPVVFDADEPISPRSVA